MIRTEVHRRNLSKATHTAWQDPLTRWEMMIMMRGVKKYRPRTGRIYRSCLEERAQDVVRRVFPDAKHHLYLPNSSHPYDFVSRESKVVIEVDGCYWHTHGCGLDERWDMDIMEKDIDRGLVAWRNGYKLLTLWECQEGLWLRKLLRFQKGLKHGGHIPTEN